MTRNLLCTSKLIKIVVIMLGLLPGTEAAAGDVLLLYGDGTSTTFTDSSPANNTADITGSVTETSNQSQNKNAIFMNGASDYLTVDDSADWDFGSGSFTIDFWAKNNGSDISENQSVALLTRKSTGGLQSWVVVGDNDELRFRYYVSGVDWKDTLTISSDFESTWNHYAVTRGDDNIFRTYKNGVLQDASTTADSSSLYDDDSAIGIGKMVFQKKFYGYIDDIRINKGTDLSTSGTPYTFPETVRSCEDCVAVDYLSKILAAQ